MSTKQDRQGVRTATQLEQKYSFGKTFADLLGLINENRDHVDAVESSVKDEIKQMESTLTRNAEELKATVSMVTETKEKIDMTITSTEDQFYLSDSQTELQGGEWSSAQPTWQDGKYMWMRRLIVYASGITTYTPDANGVCISGSSGKDGVDGEDGEDAILLMIHSSNGNLFKNDGVSTTLTVEIMVGGLSITSSEAMRERFGENSQIIWKEKKNGETEYTQLPASDTRLSDNGFIFTLSAKDLKYSTVYNCFLDY